MRANLRPVEQSYVTRNGQTLEMDDPNRRGSRTEVEFGSKGHERRLAKTKCRGCRG